MSRPFVLVVVLVLGVARARSASADDAIVRGAVVKIEAKEIYVDLGRDRGVVDGAALRLKRTISLRHPVTRALVEDWVPIGAASVTQAGNAMSRAVVGELVTDVKVGDIAEVLVVAATPRPPTSLQPSPPTPQAATVDPETAELLLTFARQSGQSLDARIASWERFLSTRPGSPYAAAIRRDLDTLRDLREELRPATIARDTETLAAVQHAAPDTAPADAAIPVVFVLDRPDHVASAYLHYRRHGARTYRSLLLVREHDIYLRGVVPADVVQPPGLDYFVEVSTPAGRSGLALGSPEQPVAVAVAGPAIIDRFGSTPGRSSVKLAADYLDFKTLDRRDGDHEDHVVHTTVEFTYRLDDSVESLGVGYGVYSGVGGYADRTWTMAEAAPKSGFDYGYADIEIGGHVEKVHVSAGGQLIAGVGRQGFGLGFEGRLRIGDRDSANLLLSTRTIDQVGWLSLVRFGTRLTSLLGLGVSVAATDQPNQGDVGVVLGSDLEIAIAPTTALLVHGSWQGRSVDHGGLGGGAGLGVYW